MNKIYGYWRISCGSTQEETRQIKALRDSGCEIIRGDKMITGISNYGDREKLSTLLDE